VLTVQTESIIAPCPVFGECGGCFYQNIPYEEELKGKEAKLKSLLKETLALGDDLFEPIVPSPKPYHYRNRLDLKLLRTRKKEIFMGFSPREGRRMIPVDACPIADERISAFIPELKTQVMAKLPEKYRLANIVVRNGENGRVLWGGIGRGSCQLQEEDYFWVDIHGRKIYYSLDTFFQANLSILPRLFERLKAFDFWSEQEISFYDLYGGVGLFGIGLADKVKKVFLIEECQASLRLARYNVRVHHFQNFEVVEGRVEDKLPVLLQGSPGGHQVAFIDPPRAGLSPSALRLLASAKNLNYLFYLSCNPEALARDLTCFVNQGWKVKRIMPFDFFPKTRHLETLVLLVL